MKKIYLICALLFCAVISSYGQRVTSGTLPDFSEIYFPDSVTSYFPGEVSPFQKIIRIYNSDNKCVLEEAYGVNHLTNNLTPQSKIIYEYGTGPSKDKQTLMEMQRWNISENKWEPSGKTIFEFNENGAETLYISYTWNPTISAWMGNYKDVYEYDENGYFIKGQTFLFNNSNMDWQTDPFTTTHSTYIDGKLSSTTSETLNTKTKYDYTYDQNNNLILDEMFEQISGNTNWTPIGKSVYTYNSDNKITQKESFSMSEGNWINGSLTKYDWDQDGNETLYEYYKWNKAENKWIGDKKTDNNYSSTEHVRIGYTWLNEIDNWAQSSKAVYNYNNTQQLLSYKTYLYLWDSENFESQVEKETSKQEFIYNEEEKLSKINYYENNHTNLTYYDLYYYPKSGSGIANEINEADINVYFAGSNLIIDSPYAETVTVYSLSGSLITIQNKEVGAKALNIGVIGQPVIVKGSIGWVRKIY